MRLRRATLDDLPYLRQLEQRFCSLGFVGGDDAGVHERQMANADCLYYMVEQKGERAGYVILRGLTSINRCVELKRIVIAEPGRGVGRQVLRAIIDKGFGELSAHRLWLDVYDDNHRARHIYRSLGFVEEGTLRECIECEGRYRSLVVMSMLESEYRAAAARTHAASKSGSG
ncbi:MAG: GNAT family protein [Terriglobia bacterium]|jgi:RimJ/RimL family protein N-acetyltransferase